MKKLFEITSFTLEKDYSVSIKEGGTRPLVAKATINFPGGYSNTEITLGRRRTEYLLNEFQEHIAGTIMENLTRQDDKLIGREDVIVPEPPLPASAEELLAELIDEEGPQPGTGEWASRVKRFLAEQQPIKTPEKDGIPQF